MEEDPHPIAIIAGSLWGPYILPVWALAIAALVASLRRRRGALPLHLLLAGAQTAALIGAYCVHFWLLPSGCGFLFRDLQFAMLSLLTLVLPVVAVAPVVVWRSRRCLRGLWPGPALSVIAGCGCALIVVIGTPVALSTRYRTWPTWSAVADLFRW